MKNDFTLNILKKKSLDFSLQMIALHENLEGRRSHMSIQLLRTSTNIGALINAAEYGTTKDNILSKLTKVAQEANKVIYRLTY